MLSQMFEQFYAHVRHEQYLQFLENCVHFEFNFIPIIDEKKLDYEMQNYFTETEAVEFSYRTLINITSIPRTYVYSINKDGKFVFKKFETFEEVMKLINEKKYQEIEFLSNPSS